jgi:hypothetical protein
VIITTFGVGHDGEFELRLVVADDAAQVLLSAIFPAAMFALLDAFARRLVAELHVIHAGGDAGVIHHLHGFIVEMVIVHQSTVANGAIEDFDFGPVGEPAALGRFLGFGGFGGFGAHKLGLKKVFVRHYPANSLKHKAGVNEGGWIQKFDAAFRSRPVSFGIRP